MHGFKGGYQIQRSAIMRLPASGLASSGIRGIFYRKHTVNLTPRCYFNAIKRGANRV